MIKKEITKLFPLLPFIDLCTVGEDGTPEVRAMLNLRNAQICPHLKGRFKDGDCIFYFTTNEHSGKMKQIKKNNKASVYMTDPQTFEGALLLGVIEEEKDKKTKDGFWHDSWKMYYPQGRDGADYCILRFTPKSYKYYDGKFNVQTGNV
ncbi:MAG: pyridoxamine 5'-phosphate oxidase family protein [Elusimicrobium sp.]|jgi:general stress protein 26|nr:pyridoxamine 5'-phosphate oxidase family protein [Elusimicrobium sp.]